MFLDSQDVVQAPSHRAIRVLILATGESKETETSSVWDPNPEAILKFTVTKKKEIIS